MPLERPKEKKKKTINLKKTTNVFSTELKKRSPTLSRLTKKTVNHISAFSED